MNAKDKKPIQFMSRKMLRNQLRAKFGNKGMREIWRDMQVKKLGEKAYINMRRVTDPKGRHNKSYLATAKA